MDEKEIKGVNYFTLALLAFGSIGLELILVLIEPFIYRQDISMGHWTSITHWILTLIIWSFAIFYLMFIL